MIVIGSFKQGLNLFISLVHLAVHKLHLCLLNLLHFFSILVNVIYLLFQCVYFFSCIATPNNDDAKFLTNRKGNSVNATEKKALHDQKIPLHQMGRKYVVWCIDHRATVCYLKLSLWEDKDQCVGFVLWFVCSTTLRTLVSMLSSLPSKVVTKMWISLFAGASAGQLIHICRHVVFSTLNTLMQKAFPFLLRVASSKPTKPTKQTKNRGKYSMPPKTTTTGGNT